MFWPTRKATSSVCYAADSRPSAPSRLTLPGPKPGRPRRRPLRPSGPPIAQVFIIVDAADAAAAGDTGTSGACLVRETPDWVHAEQAAARRTDTREPVIVGGYCPYVSVWKLTEFRVCRWPLAW
jgi:hypothetical protein